MRVAMIYAMSRTAMPGPLGVWPDGLGGEGAGVEVLAVLTCLFALSLVFFLLLVYQPTRHPKPANLVCAYSQYSAQPIHCEVRK